jgi:hypothetical protein
MRAIVIRLTPVISALVLALTLPSADTRLTVAALALAALAIVVTASVVATPHIIVIGARASAHREPLSRMAAQSHPAAAGKPRPRAPGMRVPAA